MERKHHQESENYKFSLQTKLQQLEQKLSTLVEELRLAAIEGDLSESFDWTVSGERIGRLREEILVLKQKIAAANRASFPSKILTYQLLATNQTKTIQLTDFLLEEAKIYSEEKKMFLRQVSYTSPLGAALADKKIGEIGKVETKKGGYLVKIINIEEK